jgi:hypothetical protein
MTGALRVVRTETVHVEIDVLDASLGHSMPRIRMPGSFPQLDTLTSDKNRHRHSPLGGKVELLSPPVSERFLPVMEVSP